METPQRSTPRYVPHTKPNPNPGTHLSRKSWYNKGGGPSPGPLGYCSIILLTGHE
jgi:hypothetical protein